MKYRIIKLSDKLFQPEYRKRFLFWHFWRSFDGGTDYSIPVICSSLEEAKEEIEEHKRGKIIINYE